MSPACYSASDICIAVTALLIGLARGEVLLQEVRCDVVPVIAGRRCHVFMGSDHRNGVLTHQTIHATLLGVRLQSPASQRVPDAHH
jgi:hypothetical protein